MSARKGDMSGPFELRVGRFVVKGVKLPNGTGFVVVSDDAVGTLFSGPAEAATAFGIAVQAVAACAQHAPEPTR